VLVDSQNTYMSKRKENVAVKRLRTATLVMCLVLAMGVAASAMAPNLEFVVPKVDKAPEIDGKLDDAAWLNASIKGGKTVVDLDNTGTELTEYPRIAYLCWDDEALYVAYTIFAPDVTKLETAAGSLWSNDEVELFLDPDQKGLYTQWGVDAGDNLQASVPGRDQVKMVASKSGIRWVIEMAIPWDKTGASAPPKVGDKWGMNLCGHQIATGSMWLCWNCTFGGFHNASKFGVITFGE